MPKPPVPLAVLAALGLDAHANDTDDTDACDTDDTDQSDTFGPCLDFVVEPCLSQLPPRKCGCDATDGSSLMLAGALALVAIRRGGSRAWAKRGVLDDGVLPEDLARALEDEAE